MTRAAIYARYSSAQQREASIEDQVRLCEERAAREGWAVHERYADHGISGASLMRPGVQALLRDAMAGQVRGGPDRVARPASRATRRTSPASTSACASPACGSITLSEGEIGELHIGFKGTMGALYLKDLADKTRRGLRGRVEAGLSGGGNSYGYDVVTKFAANGEPDRGERRINEDAGRDRPPNLQRLRRRASRRRRSPSR